MIDFRSDTVTVPCAEMKKAMFEAEVGDDVFGEDPSINELQSYIANYFGKEAALYCSSGTQTNQIAINVHVQPGDEVICHEESHIYKYEGGGIAKNSGASVRLLRGNRGRLFADEIAQYFNPDDVHYPVTRLVSIEDTANRGGGAVYDFEEIKKINRLCKKMQVPFHLDGARMMNALAVNKIDPKVYAAEFDSFSLCLSKGIGAPVGSVLVGEKEFIQKAKRVRKVFGGGMRQAGSIAAGALYAFKNNIVKIEADHLHAKRLEAALLELNWVKEVVPVETNIVVSVLHDPALRDVYIEKMKEQGVLTMAFGPGMIRMVTHLNISSDDISNTISILKGL
jgi:threonine aldolase